MPDGYDRMLKVVQHGHASQFRNGSVPYWHHCDRVARLLATELSASKEGGLQTNNDGVVAALGHDLYEDTEVTRESIKKEFGKPVDVLIEEVTNRQGDDNLELYLKQLVKDSEMGRLIKLADLADNYLDGSFGLHTQAKGWGQTFLIPILDSQLAVLTNTKFTEYPQTADSLLRLIKTGRAYLYSAVERQA